MQMLKNYINRSLMLLGAAAVVATAQAGAYRDVTAQFITNHNYAGGWQGAITAIGEGVGEVYNGAFNLYQTLSDMPAGEYTLTVNAFYRCGDNDYAQANMAGRDDLHTTYIYINGEKKAVMGLFEETIDAAPNSMWDANNAFTAGKYLNTVTVNHPGGDMVVGIANTGSFNDEWSCFDNFKLNGPNGDVSGQIVNNDFSIGMDANPMTGWDAINAENAYKYPDVNKAGGAYRKTNASIYNYGQRIDLPAGKYRFGMLTFHRYGGDGDHNGEYITCKGDWGYVAGKSPKDWFDANNYDADEDYAHAFIYVGMGEDKIKNLDTADNFGDYDPDRGDVRVRIKDCWELTNGDVSAMPHNLPMVNEGTAESYATHNSLTNRWWDGDLNDYVYGGGWGDSGNERQSSAAFVNNPDTYRQWAEFELTAPAKVWVGFGKNANTGDQYWHPWADIRLEQWDDNYEAGVEGIVADAAEADAPAVYYNLQGVQVAEPTNGIYIVKQGNKVTKQVIR